MNNATICNYTYLQYHQDSYCFKGDNDALAVLQFRVRSRKNNQLHGGTSQMNNCWFRWFIIHLLLEPFCFFALPENTCGHQTELLKIWWSFSPKQTNEESRLRLKTVCDIISWQYRRKSELSKTVTSAASSPMCDTLLFVHFFCSPAAAQSITWAAQ